MISEKITSAVQIKDRKIDCLDIEELVTAGQINNICPYYLSKSRLA